jgi:hypothetical protein
MGALVVASGRTLIREIVALPDDTLSFLDGVDEVKHSRSCITCSPDVFHALAHTDKVPRRSRSQREYFPHRDREA